MPRAYRNSNRFAPTRLGARLKSVGTARVPKITVGPSWADNANGTATVTWTTDILSDSRVNYGATSSYGSTQYSATLVTSHSVVVTASPATYQFNTGSVNGQGAFNSANQQGVIT